MINKDKFEEIYNHLFSEDMIENDIFKKIFKNINLLDSEFSLFSGLTKITHSTLQSLDIKFGYFLEKLTNEFLYQSSEVEEIKSNHSDKSKQKLETDSNFLYKDIEYILEIKKRNNHDSTKWEGQMNNLIKKFKNSNHKEKMALIYFIDISYGKKNDNNYQKKWIENMKNDNFKILYGSELFEYFEFLNKNDWENYMEYVKISSDRINKFINNFLMNIENEKPKVIFFIEKAHKYINLNFKTEEKRDENKQRVRGLFKENIQKDLDELK